MVVAGGAWPLLVALTPASSRPWISGTSDNSIWSLITGYNGLGRLDGQAGGPGGGGMGGGGGGVFGGDTGVFRLLNSALGGQAGWLLGFALVAGVALVVSSRLRRSDPVTGWVMAVGGSALTAAVAFSTASGIFHPYYVSELAPFVAALVGAGVVRFASGDLVARIAGPLAIARRRRHRAQDPGRQLGLVDVAAAAAGRGRRRDGGRARLRPGRAHPQRRAGDRAGDIADRPGDLVGPDARSRHVGHVPGRAARPARRWAGWAARAAAAAAAAGFGGGQGGRPSGGQFGGPPGANGAAPNTGTAPAPAHPPTAARRPARAAASAAGRQRFPPRSAPRSPTSRPTAAAPLLLVEPRVGGDHRLQRGHRRHRRLLRPRERGQRAWLADQVAQGKIRWVLADSVRRRRAGQRRPHRLHHRDGRGRAGRHRGRRRRRDPLRPPGQGRRARRAQGAQTPPCEGQSRRSSAPARAGTAAGHPGRRRPSRDPGGPGRH